MGMEVRLPWQVRAREGHYVFPVGAPTPQG